MIEAVEKPLLVIADERSVMLWKTVGAMGITFSPEKMHEIIEYIKAKGPLHKAALVGETVYEKGFAIVKQLNEKEIPWIVLLDKSSDEKMGYKELEKLSEKAVGMSLAIH